MMVGALVGLREEGKGEVMRRLFAVLVVLGGVLLMTATNSSAARFGNDASDPSSSAFFPSRVHHASGEASGGINLKISCTSDSGDTCTCGAGKLCIAGADGCTCFRPN